jgi:methylase of polypeptide subunit release factors
MGSLIKNYSKNKLLGIVYTPESIVNKILDDINYNNQDILGKRILDPACGDGMFLSEIVRRIIKFSDKKNLKKHLDYVHGWDIDLDAVIQCKKRLNQILSEHGFTEGIDWNINHKNSLFEIEKYHIENIFCQLENIIYYDYIVGNPPYIRIQHLDEIQRKYIQNKFQFCKRGSTDIFIAFIELCTYLLSKNGICGLITPNTYFNTDTSKDLRKHFARNKNILQITNFKSIQVFENATTYSSIIIFNKNENEFFKYEEAVKTNEFIKTLLPSDILKNEIWQLSVNGKINPTGTKLKDICKIHVGITTLYDKAYIFTGYQDFNEDLCYVCTSLKGKILLEKNILRPIVKVSRLKNSKIQIKEYILFPYEKIGNKNKIIPEEKLKNDYPYAYTYLLSIKDELSKRDNGKPIFPWYGFGRNQGLDTSFGKKILFSPMNIKPNFILCDDENITFYSGYCIKYNGDYNKLLKQLNSKKMEDFIRVTGRDFRGGWKSYNKKIVQEFPVNPDEL